MTEAPAARELDITLERNSPVPLYYQLARSIEDAINSAVSRASSTLRNLRWFEEVRTSGHIADGMVQHYQVTMKVGFTMEGAG